MRMWWCFCCVPPFSSFVEGHTTYCIERMIQNARAKANARGEREKEKQDTSAIRRAGRKARDRHRTYRRARDERERCCPTLWRLIRTTSLFIKHTNLQQLSSSSSPFRGNSRRGCLSFSRQALMASRSCRFYGQQFRNTLEDVWCLCALHYPWPVSLLYSSTSIFF